MKNWKSKYGFHLFFLGTALCLLLLGAIIPSVVNPDLDPNLDLELSHKEITNSQGREELQRYFGYEKLFYRYLTVPFDSTISNNQLGRFLDIGFLLLAFIPIFFILKQKNRRSAIVFASLILIFYLSISMHNTQIIDYNNKTTIEANVDPSVYLDNNNFSDGISTYILVKTKQIISPIFYSIDFFIEKISKDKDYVTYPFISLILIYLSLLIIRREPEHLSSEKLLLLALFNFGFFWLLLSAGIIWYGFMLLILGYIYLGKEINENLKSNAKSNRLIGRIGLGFLIAWIGICVFSRISYIPAMMTGSELAKNMLHKDMSDYAVGKLTSAEEVMEAMHPGLNSILEKINAETTSNVLKIGTSFTSFIKNNQARVHADNQLVMIKWLSSIYNDQKTITEVLKSSNFKYLIVDLHLLTIDQTPEKTLTNKFQKLLQYIYENPELVLLNTNRIVRNPEIENGMKYEVFGKILRNGSYAIYEIL